MRNFLPCQPILLLALVASVASANEHNVVERTLNLSEHPEETAHRIYAAGRIATVLRFEKDVDPARTKMLGWEGWFEPLLVGGKKVVLEPLRHIEPGDRFMLLVTLVDGTEIPFIVTSREQPLDGRREADQQVSVFRNLESPNAAQTSLYESLKRERALQEKVSRYEQEDSVDHALAALLAKGATKLTPFRRRQFWRLNDGDADFEISVYSGKDKAAVLFRVTNQEESRPWSMKQARLYTASGWTLRPFALRMTAPEIVPGASGQIAVVADRSAFQEGKELQNLILELYRADGLRQVVVLLDHRLLGE